MVPVGRTRTEGRGVKLEVSTREGVILVGVQSPMRFAVTLRVDEAVDLATQLLAAVAEAKATAKTPGFGLH